jgi:hypothetical protein
MNEIKEFYSMRNPDRIDVFLKYLGILWKKYPDLRFPQIIAILKTELKEVDDFYIEDDDYFGCLVGYLENKEVICGITGREAEIFYEQLFK